MSPGQTCQTALTLSTNSYMGETGISVKMSADVQLQKSFAVQAMDSGAIGGVWA